MRDQRGIEVRAGDRALFGSNICTVQEVNELGVAVNREARLLLQPEPIVITFNENYVGEAKIPGLFVLPADSPKTDAEPGPQKRPRLV